MLTVRVPKVIADQWSEALRRAKEREIGGILMGEHLADGSFRIAEITVHRPGAFASFVRFLEEAIQPLKRFLERTDRDYRRFNYLGEWHSHPNFPAIPSRTDHQTMSALVEDREVGANFAVLMVIKLGRDGALEGTVQAYLASGELVHGQWSIEGRS